jgi:DDE superfamily endonuclease
MVNHMREPIFARWFACCRSVRWQQDGDKRPLTLYGAVSPMDGACSFLILPRSAPPGLHMSLPQPSAASRYGVLSDFPRQLGQTIFQATYPTDFGRRPQSYHRRSVDPANITLEFLPPCSPELNPQENIWDEIREKIFKNYALRSMDEVCDKLEEAALYITLNATQRWSNPSRPFHISSVQCDVEMV